MRVIITSFLLLLVTVAQAQESTDSEDILKNNEVKLNVGYLIARYLEVSYERVLNEESSVGLSLSCSLNEEVTYNFGFIPYYRFFFGKKRSSGFFLEASGAFYSRPVSANNHLAGLGFGIAIGKKLITKKGFVFEIFGGIGRNFINTKRIEEFYPRLGLTIGKQF